MENTVNHTANLAICDQAVVTLAYNLSFEGKVEPPPRRNGRLQFIQGAGQIPAGLERELYGLKVGERKTIHVKAQDGFGEVDPEAAVEIPRVEIPAEIPVETGLALRLDLEDGDWVEGFIQAVDEKMVLLSLNHPLAGKDLTFKVAVQDVRPASREELNQGCVLAD